MSHALANWEDYELLDSGDGQKLERFGPIKLIRPEERATWHKAATAKLWKTADAEFQKDGGWKHSSSGRAKIPWNIRCGGLLLRCEISESRQVGIFPENFPHWIWVGAECKKRQQPQVLNLFGYTGISSLAAAQAGADVTHVDASRKALNWAKLNQHLSGLDDARVRWIEDDAVKFVEREIRRGRKYTGIILDPPAYGMGPRQRRWEFETGMERLAILCKEILDTQEGFIVLTAYSLRRQPEYLIPIFAQMVGEERPVERGSLNLLDTSGGRKIEMAIFARWSGLNPAVMAG